MDKNNETVQKILADKPIKPVLEEFSLTEGQVKELEQFKSKCESKSKLYSGIAFGIISALAALIIILYGSGYRYIILTTIASAIMSWGIIPFLIKLISKKELKDLIFHFIKTSNIESINSKNDLFIAAMAEYKKKNDIFERAIGRMTNNYWLSLNPKAFEDAVAELFADNGWDVYTTPVTRDEGVDLFLEKDGVKAIVQCKTYKKVLGPNAARDLYGTMTAQNASHAYLAAPGGFSAATKTFCEGKPITLVDLDGLSKMFYPFENYIPHWIDSAKSIDDIRKGINKHIYSGKGYGRRRY
jgi:HJR/Mrr/RecB family endonuclease